MIEQAKFAYSPLGKSFEKQIKTIEDQEIKQLESIEGLFPKNMRTDEIKNETYEIKKWEEKIKRKDFKTYSR